MPERVFTLPVRWGSRLAWIGLGVSESPLCYVTERFGERPVKQLRGGPDSGLGLGTVGEEGAGGGLCPGTQRRELPELQWQLGAVGAGWLHLDLGPHPRFPT